jgi:two-component SAPR family response regulator
LNKQYSHWRYPGKFIDYINLVERIPMAISENYPHLLLNKARFLMYLGETTAALKLFKGLVKKFHRRKERKGMAEALYLTGLVYLTLMEVKKAISFMRRAYSLIGKRYGVEKVEILIGFGSAYRILCRYRKAETYLKNALRIVKKLKNIKLEINTLRSLADLYWAWSDYKRADEIYTEIFSKFKEDITEFALGKMYGNAALVAVNSNNITKALDHLTRAEKIAYRYNDLRTITFLLVVRGEFYVYDGECEKAIECFEKALEMNKKIKEKLLDHYILVDICDAYIKMGKINAAHATLRTLEPIISAKDSPQSYIEYLLAKGKIETEEGNFSKALDSFDGVMQITKKIHQIQQEMNAHYEMSSYYLRMGKENLALRHLKKCLTIGKKYSYDTFIILEGKYNFKPLAFAADNLLFPDYLVLLFKQIDTTEAHSALNRMNIRRGIYDIECSFFGQFQIRDRNKRIVHPKWRDKRARSLFILLVTASDRGILKDKLIDIFWSGRGIREGTHSLQVEISHVRKVLKKIIKSDIDTKDLIVFQNQKYRFNPGLSVKTDIEEFDELVMKANSLEGNQSAKSIRLYYKAIELYKGDFCDDIVDEWTEDNRQHYKITTIKIYKKIGDYYYNKKNLKKCLEFYKKANSLDQYDESVHLGLMKCYVALNNKERVQKQYKILMKVLQKLGISRPTQEVIDIYKKSLK